MLNALIRASLRQRPLVLFLSALLLLAGALRLPVIPLDVLPDLTAPTVTILVEGPGMLPAEMEAQVTFPVESALNGAAGVRRVRSATAVGVAVIWVEFDWGQEIFRARQTVSEKLTLLAASLPPGVEAPYLAPVSSIMGEILFVALNSERHSELELRTVADTVIRRRILAVPGVSQVVPTGGGQKQYQVLLSPELLREYGVSLGQVRAALEKGSQNASAGFRLSGGQEYLIQASGRANSEAELGQIVVDLKAGRPTLLRDVAEVKVGAALKRGEGSHNGRPAVILGIQKQPGANTLELTRRLDTTIDEIQKGLPAGMKMDRHVFRQADFIERALGNLALALRDGSLLVVLVVVIFLMNWRAALVTLLALPLSAITAVLAMQAFGYTLNSMSLGGLAIAIGELVDDAIIDVENVLRRLRENAALAVEQQQLPLEVVYQASVEIRSSVLFGTVIVILVFLPLFALSSVEGRLLQPLGFAYVVSLSASLLVALTVTPALCSLLLPAHSGVGEPWLVRSLKAAYHSVLAWTLRHPRLVLSAAALTVALSFWPLSGFGRAFLPDFNEGSLTLSAVTLPGTSLAESDSLGRSLERVLLSVPEVVSTARRTGRAELDEHVQGVESAELDVALKETGRPKSVVLAELRDKATLMPGMNVTFGQPISHRIDHMLSGTRANIALKIFGDDLTLLRALAAQVERAAGTVEGVVDLSTEQQTDIPTLRVRVRPEDAARFALTPGEVAESVRVASFGREVGRVFEGQLSFPVVLRYPQMDLRDLNVLRRMLLDSPSGAKVPVEAVADVFEDRGPNFISRENVQRKIVVQANVAGRDLRSTVEAIRGAIEKSVVFPPGYRLEYGGQFESEAEASRRLAVLGGMVLVATFFLLMSAFGNAKHAAVILLNLPLALVGGVYGVAAGGGVLSVASLIGFITLFGIATRNGIMLVSHIQQTGGENAVARAAAERLIPILMTALTAALALVPIANGLGKPGSEIQAPMALVILYGLLSSTVLNMLVVPAAYVLVEAQRGPKS